MSKTKSFKSLKEEILRRAKEASACKTEYGRAYRSENYEQLMEVLRDNFHWAYNNGVLDACIIEQYREEFAEGKIYLNVDVSEGFLLAYGNASVEAWDNAIVIARDNASVIAWDNASVRAYGNASVRAYGNASVEAYGNASVEARDNASVRAYGNASVEARDNASVRAYGNASVRARDNAYITSYYTIECKLSDKAIYRIRETNTIRYTDENIKFEKV